MKKSRFTFVCLTLGFCHANLFAASAVAPKLSASDQAWLEMQAPLAPRSPASGQQPTGPAEMRAVMAARAATAVVQADRAKNFHVLYPGHEKAPEARLTEVRALLNAVQMGDATVEGRLAAAVQALREDKTAPASIRVQAVAAYDFSRKMRGLKTHQDRLEAIEEVARSLIVEFPDQPQGYESLLSRATSASDDTKARKISRELIVLAAPAAVKEGAQKLLGRLDLVGKPLKAELVGANETGVNGKLQEGVPTIVYSWASWSPGSLALAARLKAEGATANFVGVNLDTDRSTAESIAQREGLIGNLIFDSRGREGALAQRLKIGTAGEVLLVDARGLIREVRGQGDLKNKLKQIGL